MKGVFDNKDVSGIYQSVRKDSYWLFFKKYLKGVVTEIGCGTGANAILSRDMKKVKRYNCIDGSKDMLRFVELECIDKVKIYCEDLDGKVKLPKSDVIVAKFLFHHIEHKKELLKATYDCLSKDGRLVMIDKFPKTMFGVNFIEKILKVVKVKNLYGKHHYCSYKDFLNMANDLGFKREYERIKPGRKSKNFYVKRVFLVFRK